MGAMRLGLAALLVALAGGCPSRAPDDALDDGAVAAADAAADAALICRAHALQEVTLLSFELIDGPGPYSFGTTTRVLAAVPLRDGCDVLGPVEVELTPGNATDFVTVIAHVWRGDVDCGPVRAASRVLTLPNENARVTVRDGAAGGTAMTGWDTAYFPGPPPDCAMAAPGGVCSADCQCEAGASGSRCLQGQLNASGICAFSCSEDADCGWWDVPSCGTGPASLTFVCGPSDGCTDAECPHGQRCQPDTASCRALDTSFASGACACDSDCAAFFGQVCDTSLGRCIHPCATNANCALPFGCGADGICTAKI